MNNEGKILEILLQLQSDMSTVKADITGLKADMTGVKADVTGLKADMTGVKADISTIKTKMAAMEARIDQIDERSQRTAFLLETEYRQKLNLLYEGHGTIMETLTPKERIEKAEADIAVLKVAVRTLSEEIHTLKKAQ